MKDDRTNLGDIEPTEDGVAREFTARFADDLKFDHDAGRWFQWAGDHWQPETTGLAFDFCRSLAHDASLGVKPAASVRKANFAAGVERFARCDRAHAVRQDVWDRDPWALACPGVTVDLRTGRTRPPNPADLITRLAGTAPAERADCPRWLAFLEEATGADAGMIRFMRQWSGYCLTGDTSEHALLFIWGDGGNGKGVFLRTVAGVTGDYAAAASMETFTAARFERHPTDLAALRSARLVTASETTNGRPWDDARIKALTGGDPITARFMRQDEFTYQPVLKLTIAGNHRPLLQTVDEAMRRRLNMVPFTHKPARVDRELEAKLRPEWPAILRWMLDGCADWRSNGLVRPQSGLDATDDYFDAQDAFGQWLEEECTVEIGNTHRWETAHDLFKSWSRFARAAGEEPGSQKALGDAMTRRRFSRQTRRVGRTAKGWCGITLNRPEAREQ